MYIYPQTVPYFLQLKVLLNNEVTKLWLKKKTPNK